MLLYFAAMTQILKSRSKFIDPHLRGKSSHGSAQLHPFSEHLAVQSLEKYIATQEPLL